MIIKQQMQRETVKISRNRIEDKQQDQSSASSEHSVHSIGGKDLIVAKKVLGDILEQASSFNSKKRFLNWDPLQIYRGEDFDPQEVIRSTRSIHETLKKKEELQRQMRDIAKGDGLNSHDFSYSYGMRTKEELD